MRTEQYSTVIIIKSLDHMLYIKLFVSYFIYCYYIIVYIVYIVYIVIYKTILLCSIGTMLISLFQSKSLVLGDKVPVQEFSIAEQT